MNIVPTHNLDLDTCNNLSLASDEEIYEKIPELLEWIQDINWPVAQLICKRLENIGSPLIEPVRKILHGSDDIWKYWVISILLGRADKDIVCSLKPELERIINNPTNSEMTEEVNIVVGALLEKCQ